MFIEKEVDTKGVNMDFFKKYIRSLKKSKEFWYK